MGYGLTDEQRAFRDGDPFRARENRAGYQKRETRAAKSIAR